MLSIWCVILASTRLYMKLIVVVNKVDLLAVWNQAPEWHGRKFESVGAKDIS